MTKSVKTSAPALDDMVAVDQDFELRNEHCAFPQFIADDLFKPKQPLHKEPHILINGRCKVSSVCSVEERIALAGFSPR